MNEAELEQTIEFLIEGIEKLVRDDQIADILDYVAQECELNDVFLHYHIRSRLKT
jgi:hypothetical protein